MQQTSFHDSGLGSSRPSAFSEAASRAQPASFHDSGLGSSHPSALSKIASHVQPALSHDFATGIPHSSAPLNIESQMEKPPVQESTTGAPHPSAAFPVPPQSVSGLSASTIFSLASALGSRPPIPPMPTDSGSQTGFSCTICYHLQGPILKKRQWR